MCVLAEHCRKKHCIYYLFFKKTIEIDESKGNRLFGNKYRDSNVKLGEGTFGDVFKAESIQHSIRL